MKFKKYSFQRILKADNKYIIKNIKIFDYISGIVIYQSNQGWLESEKKDIIEMNLLTCKRKIKLNLNIKQPFIIKEKNNYSLYIPRDFVKLKELGENILYKSEIYNMYANFFEITLKCILTDETEEKTHKLKLFSFSRNENTNFGDNVKFWKEKLEEEKIKIDSFSLIKLLKKYKFLEKII